MLGIYHGHIVVQLKAARADWGLWVGFTCGSWSSEPFTCRVIHDTPQVNMVLVPGCISALCSPDMYVIRGGVWGVWEQCDHHQRIMIPVYCMRHRPVVAVMLWDKKPTS